MTVLSKLFLLAIGLMLFFAVRSMFAQSSKAVVVRSEPTVAAAKVRDGKAILIDVREPNEWEAGVAAPAYLLPMSDLRGNRTKWMHVLAESKETPIYLYCRSGNRSGQAAEILAKEGFNVANIGGYNEWKAAGLPTRSPDEPAGND